MRRRRQPDHQPQGLGRQSFLLPLHRGRAAEHDLAAGRGERDVRHDGADWLTSVHHDGPSGALAHYDYTLDANGNRTSMTTAAGTESYTLDALNRLTSVSYPNGDATSYAFTRWRLKPASEITKPQTQS